MYRSLLLSGDFFLGGVIAVNLAKLILRLRALGLSQVSIATGVAFPASKMPVCAPTSHGEATTCARCLC